MNYCITIPNIKDKVYIKLIAITAEEYTDIILSEEIIVYVYNDLNAAKRDYNRLNSILSKLFPDDMCHIVECEIIGDTIKIINIFL